jgi:hypothetical protein
LRDIVGDVGGLAGPVDGGVVNDLVRRVDADRGRYGRFVIEQTADGAVAACESACVTYH